MSKHYKLTGMLICFVLLVSSVSSGQEKESNSDKILSLLPKDTFFVIVIDVGRIIGTPFHEQLKENEYMQEWRRGYLETTGIDPQEDIEKIVFLMREDNGDVKNSSIMLTSGSFNKDKVIKAEEEIGEAITKKELYQGETIYKFEKEYEETEVHLVFLEDFLVKIVEPMVDVLKSVIDVYHGKKENITVNQTLMSKIKEVIQENAVWGFFIPPQQLEDKEDDPMSKALFSATSIIFSGDAQEELSCSAEFKYENEENAKNFYDLINGFIAMGKMNLAKSEMPEFVGMLLEKLTMKIKANDIIISTSITAEYFIKIINEMKNW
jgi:hypothetical protein